MGVTNFNQVQVDADGLIVGTTPITATSAEINAALDGISVTAAEINSGVQPTAVSTDGLGRKGVAIVTFDASIVANQSIAPHVMDVELPAFAVVNGGFFDVNTVFHSAGADAGTIAIHIETAGDIQVAAAVSGAPYSTIGLKAIKPKANTPESTAVKLTVARKVTFTVVGQVLSAGKLTLFLEYVVSKASA